ncbi:MAG: limonene-1,2-epoxide hydrolase family protein [Ilumatobacter sp.]|uniref:limonene-1,2-epoxide hydrolase family protein n=1 Tax=Ilumatobacter sp. TaxID=1967498 RepID=UPI00391C5A16
MSTAHNITGHNIEVVTEFIDAWSRLDPDELASYFTDDGCYHNIPVGPVAGRDNVRAMIAAFTADWTETQWDLLTIVGDGNVVIAERLDRTRAGDKSVDLPCTGVFEMANGKIKVWRDYFDLATFTSAMS